VRGVAGLLAFGVEISATGCRGDEERLEQAARTEGPVPAPDTARSCWDAASNEGLITETLVHYIYIYIYSTDRHVLAIMHADLCCAHP
jgi:hypothetical protein